MRSLYILSKIRLVWDIMADEAIQGQRIKKYLSQGRIEKYLEK